MSESLGWSESQLQSWVLEVATGCGWEWLHIETRASRGKQNGPKGTLRAWPDLTLVRGQRMVTAELKKQKAPPARTEQTRTLQLLSIVPGVEVYVWRPSDMTQILQVLA